MAVSSSSESSEPLITLSLDSLSLFTLSSSVKLDKVSVRLLSMSDKSLLESGLSAACDQCMHDDVHVDDQDRKEKT